MVFQSFNQEYVEQLAAGDAEIERHFVDYFSELLLLKLRRHLGSHHAIEDVRQETFLRVLRVLRNRGLQSPEKLGAFVHGVCNNVLSEYYRSGERLSPLPEHGYDAPAALPTPEAEMESTERKQRVRRVLNEMPPKDREILRLLFLEEQEKDEVCRIFHVDRNYLRVLLHRAKGRFRKQLPKTLAVHSRAAYV